MVLINLGLFVLSCLFLVQSSTLLVRSLSKISSFLKVNEFTVGFVLVSVATSLPEAFVGIMSAINGTPAFSVGNVIGSNILDLTFVIGIVALLAKNIKIESKIIKRDLVYMLAITFVPVVLLMDHQLWMRLGLFKNMTHGLGRIDGIILLSVFVGYMYMLIKQENRFHKLPKSTSKTEAMKSMFVFLASISILLVSSHFVVTYAEFIAIDLSLSPLIIGLFLISFGTSLPELMFQSRSVVGHHNSMALGDLVGSVIANSTLVLGITALIKPIEVESLLYLTSTMFMLFSSFIFFTFAENDNKLTWKEGMSLLMLYLLFIVVETYIKMIQGTL